MGLAAWQLVAPGAALAQPGPPPPVPAQAAPPAPAPAQPASGQVTATAGDSTGSSVLAVPPPPPAPGKGASANSTPPRAPAASFGDEAGFGYRGGGNEDSVAGWHGLFFLRDKEDHFFISPSAMLQLDFTSMLGAGVNGRSTAQAGGAGMPPRFFLRRLRLAFDGELLKRWSFHTEVDFGNDVDNARGNDQLFSAPPGQTPTGSSARYAPAQGIVPDVTPGDIWINYSLCPCLNFQFGQMRAPITMEGRTIEWQLPMMERNIAIRGFVVPAGRETGLNIWGDILDKVVTYELMVAGGDGQNRPEVDGAADFIGRILVRPLTGVKVLKDTHIGVSARHGQRDPDAVGYDYPAITSNFGYVLWNPSYKDAENRNVRVLPSGAQNEIGGELRVPVGPLDIRAEGYYVANHTREALDGYELTNTERLGTIKGGAFYGQVTWWALGDKFISGDPGYPRPVQLNLKKKVEIKRGLELTALFAGIIGDYDGNSRGGEDDASTPGSKESPGTKFTIYQFGAAASYWHSKWVRMSFNYALYFTPKSGSENNLASVPGNYYAGDATAHLLHEFGTRLQLWF